MNKIPREVLTAADTNLCASSAEAFCQDFSSHLCGSKIDWTDRPIEPHLLHVATKTVLSAVKI